MNLCHLEFLKNVVGTHFSNTFCTYHIVIKGRAFQKIKTNIQ